MSVELGTLETWNRFSNLEDVERDSGTFVTWKGIQELEIRGIRGIEPRIPCFLAWS